MYFDVFVYVFKILMFLIYYKKNSEKFSFFEISQKVKLLGPTNVLQTHINMTFAQISSFNTTLNHQQIRRYKHKVVKPTARKQQPLIGGEPPSNDIRWLSNFT